MPLHDDRGDRHDVILLVKGPRLLKIIKKGNPYYVSRSTFFSIASILANGTIEIRVYRIEGGTLSDGVIAGSGIMTAREDASKNVKLDIDTKNTHSIILLES